MKFLLALLLTCSLARAAEVDDLARQFLANVATNGVVAITNTAKNSILYFRATNLVSALAFRLGPDVVGTNEFRVDFGPGAVAGQIAFSIHSITVFGSTNIVTLTNAAAGAGAASSNFNTISFITAQGSNTLSVSNLTATAPGSSIIGVTNGGNAAAGVAGEAIIASFSASSVGMSATFFDAANIVLTPGDWDISLFVNFSRNGATFSQIDSTIGVWPDPGNSSVAAVPGINYVEGSLEHPITADNFTKSLPRYRFNTPTNATLYLKVYLGNFTVAVPQITGNISARRMR